MEPAAPVTRTTLPSREPRIWCSSRRNRRAAEQIFDGDVADLGGQTTGFDHFGESGNGLVGNAGAGALVEDAGHLRAVSARECDKDRLDVVCLDDGGQVLAGAEERAPHRMSRPVLESRRQ